MTGFFNKIFLTILYFHKHNTFLIKNATDGIVDILVYFVNLSFSTGEFPKDLRIAMVLPMHKKSDKQSPYNSRPMALLSMCSKINEKSMKSSLLAFLCYFEL